MIATIASLVIGIKELQESCKAKHIAIALQTVATMRVLGIQELCIIVGSQILESLQESWNLGGNHGILKSLEESRNLRRNLGIFKRIMESSKESWNLRRNLGIL